MTPEQCRAGRALAGLSQARLAVEADVSTGTIAYFEAGKRTPQRATIDAIKSALEENGVVITRDGVRQASNKRRPVT